MTNIKERDTSVLSHDDLATSLAEHLRGGSSRITWENMQLGDSGSPRPDVYSMEPTYTRLSFEAFECKVSRADFRSDVTSGKWQSYLKFANSVTFAVPAGLIDKKEVPGTCGLIVRSESGAWRYQKRPTRTVLTEIPWKAWIKLLLDGVHRSGYTVRHQHFSAYAANKVLSEKFGSDVGRMVADLQGLPARYEYELQAHEQQIKVLRARHTSQVEQHRLVQDAAVARCTEAVGELACALGLPADAKLADLTGRAKQLLSLLGTQDRWRRTPMVDMADRMEDLAKKLREADAVFGGAV